MKQYEETFGGDTPADQLGEALFADFAEAKQAPNPAMLRWAWRTMYSGMVAGEGLPAALARHRNEWRTVLGLKPIAPPEPDRPTSPLNVNGPYFEQDGRRWLYKGSVDFMLLQRFLHGEDISSVLNDRREAGANVVQTASVLYNIPQANGWPVLEPDYYGETYWHALDRFPSLLADFGLRLNLFVLCDCQLVGWKERRQIGHFERVCDVLRLYPNAMVTLANENGKNGVDAKQFDKPEGILSCAGTGLGDECPPLGKGNRYWDWADYHGRRDEKTPISSIDTFDVQRGVLDGWKQPNIGGPNCVIHGEPIGGADQPVPGRRSNDPELFYTIAKTVYGAGGTYHSDLGIVSLPWSETQRRCAEAFYQGLHAGV